MLKQNKLDNGFQIISQIDTNAKTLTLSFTVKCGSYNENDSNHGIAHFTEHMLFKGTTSMNAQQISEAIEGVGGILNAETSFEYTKYHCTVPMDAWEKALYVLFDMMMFNTIPEDEFEREKQVVLEELKMYDDDAHSKVYDLLLEHMHPNYKNRQSIGGTIDSVKAITRQDMVDFIDQYYMPDNMVLIVTGNIPYDELISKINQYFANVDFKNKLIKNTESEFTPDVLGQDDLIDKKDIAQSHVCWGLFGPKPTDDDYVIGEVLINLLGGNSSSRLYQIIREQKGLAYSVGMDIDPVTDSCMINGYVGLDGNNVKAVKEIIKNELNKIKIEEVTEDELQRSKAYLKGISLIHLETTRGKNTFLNNAVIYGLDIDVESYLKAIDNVTIQDIKEFANKYFRDNNICFSQVIPKN